MRVGGNGARFQHLAARKADALLLARRGFGCVLRDCPIALIVHGQESIALRSASVARDDYQAVLQAGDVRNKHVALCPTDLVIAILFIGNTVPFHRIGVRIEP